MDCFQQGRLLFSKLTRRKTDTDGISVLKKLAIRNARLKIILILSAISLSNAKNQQSTRFDQVLPGFTLNLSIL